ncbi:MAG TPA: hypothetical protein DC047_06615 [Blastocatellia bacterium]|nr:hypothetical protein [Blastocatellia bacterium]
MVKLQDLESWMSDSSSTFIGQQLREKFSSNYQEAKPQYTKSLLIKADSPVELVLRASLKTWDDGSRASDQADPEAPSVEGSSVLIGSALVES